MDKDCPMCELRARYDQSVENFDVLRNRMKGLFDGVHKMEEAEGRLLDVVTTPEKANGHSPEPSTKQRKRRRRPAYSPRTARGEFRSAQHVIKGMKLCSQCHKAKPADRSNFYYHRKSVSGFSATCIPCHIALYGPGGTRRGKGKGHIIRQHSVEAAH